MAALLAVSLEELLAPIPGDSAVGSADVYKFAEVRSALRSAQKAELRIRDAWSDEDRAKLEPPDWKELNKQAAKYLTDQAKDLWAASWMMEALVRIHGFAGLTEGMRATKALVETFWDQGMFPRVEGDVNAKEVVEQTLSQLEGLNKSLVSPIRETGITSPDNGPNAYNLSILGYEQDDISFAAAVKETQQRSAKFFEELVAQLDECHAAINELADTLDAKLLQQFGDDARDMAPSFGRPSASEGRDAGNGLWEAIAACRRLICKTAGIEDGSGESDDATETEAAAGPPVVGGPATAAAPAVGLGIANDSIRNREQAFRELERVAKFFEKTEPHSPVAPALHRVVKWGRMSLHDLLTELLDEQNARDQMFRLIGIEPKPPEPEPDSSNS